MSIQISAETKKTRRYVSMRRSGAEDMHFKGRLTDAEMAAVNRFGGHWMMQSSDGLQAINYSRLRVDGGKHSEPIPRSSATQAREHLAEVHRALGKEKFITLCVIAGERRGLADVMTALNVRSKDTASNRVREAVAALCDFWASRH